jgi:hypothetical protein
MNVIDIIDYESFESNKSVEIFLHLANEIVGKCSEYDRWCLIKQVEHDFDSEADTPLGEFLEEFVWLMLERGALDEFHQDVQDLIDVANLNEDMLICVGEHIKSYIC